jgi:hypothetical protein
MAGQSGDPGTLLFIGRDAVLPPLLLGSLVYRS